MATEKLEVHNLASSGHTADEHVHVGGRTASLGSIKLAVVGGIRKPSLKNRWIK